MPSHHLAPQQSEVTLQRGVDASWRPVRQHVSAALKAHGGGWLPCNGDMTPQAGRLFADGTCSTGAALSKERV
jgi:hypothetical protein